MNDWEHMFEEVHSRSVDLDKLEQQLQAEPSDHSMEQAFHNPFHSRESRKEL